jgi:hypothetical protein
VCAEERQAASRSGRTGCAREKSERASWWAAGPKAKKGSKFLFLFSFQIFSKHFQMILNPILNLNQSTQYKNSNATA